MDDHSADVVEYNQEIYQMRVLKSGETPESAKQNICGKKSSVGV